MVVRSRRGGVRGEVCETVASTCFLVVGPLAIPSAAPHSTSQQTAQFAYMSEMTADTEKHLPRVMAGEWACTQ